MAVYGKCKSSSGKILKIKIASTGNLYLVRDRKFWYMIPEKLRMIIINRISEAYTFNGKKAMVVKPVDETDIPQVLNFTDAVVRIYKDAAGGRQNIWDCYKKQEDQIKVKYQGFKGINWSRPAGDFGNAMIDKRILEEGKNQYLVCLSEGAVYFDFVKSAAGGIVTKTDNIDYNKPLAQLPDDAQKKVACGIGNSVAHEARHQLNIPEHADSGIGMDANRMANSMLYGTDSKFSPSDQSNIRSMIKQLSLMQCTNKTVSITR